MLDCNQVMGAAIAHLELTNSENKVFAPVQQAIRSYEQIVWWDELSEINMMVSRAALERVSVW
jgi:hypothetical protein